MLSGILSFQGICVRHVDTHVPSISLDARYYRLPRRKIAVALNEFVKRRAAR